MSNFCGRHTNLELSEILHVSGQTFMVVYLPQYHQTLTTVSFHKLKTS